MNKTLMEALRETPKESSDPLAEAILRIMAEMRRIQDIQKASNFQDERANTRYWTLKWALGEEP